MQSAKENRDDCRLPNTNNSERPTSWFLTGDVKLRHGKRGRADACAPTACGREKLSFRATLSVFASLKQVIFIYIFTTSNVLTEILSFELESTPFFFSTSDGKERAQCDQHRWNWASFCVFDRNCSNSFHVMWPIDSVQICIATPHKSDGALFSPLLSLSLYI